ncbi:phage tail protein I [Sphingomonas morindae]|uniref:Phage tail protein I n=1 Tax=Sphingomonas morindae TaxID=1541170 RepID=A0ABY4X720_9SPHN|nr:phage tail protein I [Sphingomonas morindae]USI72713.1 phage tail protein I [Sphingomonas morindae]
MISLLPRNATPLERALEAAMARLSDVPTPIEPLWNADGCPAALLPYLAYALSIDAWSPDWPEAVKRARIRRAIPIQRRKGTIQAIRDLVASYGGAVALREWWQQTPPGAPHTFALVLSLAGLGAAPSAGELDQVIDDIARAKPLRAHFTFTLSAAATGALGLIGVARPVIHARLALAAAPAPA